MFTQPVWNMHTLKHTGMILNVNQGQTHCIYIKQAGQSQLFLEGSEHSPFSFHYTQKHTGLLSWLYVQNIFSQAGKFAVLQCFDQPAQLGRPPLRLDEAAEQLIGLLIQPFSLILVGQVVYGRTLQSPAALSQSPSYVLPLTTHSIGKALNICPCQHSVLWRAKGQRIKELNITVKCTP